jgi:hypothetical protein
MNHFFRRQKLMVLMDNLPNDENVPPEVELAGGIGINNRMTSTEKYGIYQMLLAKVVNGTLRHGALAETSACFGISAKAASRIWERGGRGVLCTVAAFTDRRAEYTKDLKYNKEEIQARLIETPVEERGTIRDSAAAVGIPYATFFRYTKVHGIFRPATIATKPALTDAHCTKRLQFVRGMTNQDTGLYYEQFDSIHIDEKWFYLDKAKRKTYLAENEEAPFRQMKNKQYVEKVMFLCAVARPRKRYPNQQHLRNGGNADDRICEWSFDGKIGVWPFVEWYTAERRSRHRPRGAPLCRSIVVNHNTFQEMVLEKLLPAIRDKCPEEMRSRLIRIQLDNATPHRAISMEAFYNKANELGLNVRLIFQPAQSPDTNICDLAFFASIQSLYYKKANIRTNVDLINAVRDCFVNYNPNLLNRAFLSLFQNYNCLVLNNGNNKYKTPHMGKEQLERTGMLPTTIRALELANNVPDLGYLNENDLALDLDGLFDAIDEEEEKNNNE